MSLPECSVLQTRLLRQISKRMDYNRFFNPISLARRPSPIRQLRGMPNADLFPIQEAELKLRDGTVLKIDETQMKKALQYSTTQGSPDLLLWLKQLQKDLHNPPTLGIGDPDRQLDVLITVGSQDGICKTMEACLQDTQHVLLEKPTYPGTLAIVKPLCSKILEVNTDKDGLNPTHLRQILSRWNPGDAFNPASDIPRILYMIPNAGNPTGSSLTLERKQEIYELAQTYDLLILEDDPYYFLQFTQPYVPSFLSLDVDGRVVRFDSFSKVISGGARVGFVTGPKAILQRLNLHMQASVIHASGLSQICVLAVLNSMGHEGFKRHAILVADFYRKQCEACIAAANKHLKGLAEWSVPSGGMFLWIRLLNIADTFQLISEKARAAEVLFVPGKVFVVDDTAPSSYLRASYSLISPEKMDKAFERLAALLKQETAGSR